MKNILKLLTLITVSLSVLSSQYGMMTEDFENHVAQLLLNNEFSKVDEYIEQGRFHPLMNGNYGTRMIDRLDDSKHKGHYNSLEEFEEATDRVINRYKYLISKGDNSSVPVEHDYPDGPHNLLSSSVGNNNLRIFKFLFEEYGYKKITEYAENVMYTQGQLSFFKYIFFEVKALKVPTCDAMKVRFSFQKVKYLTGHNKETGRRFKGFFQYWDEAGIPYKHCFKHPEDRRLFEIESSSPNSTLKIQKKNEIY